jgi:hypothetical protein
VLLSVSEAFVVVWTLSRHKQLQASIIERQIICGLISINKYATGILKNKKYLDD